MQEALAEIARVEEEEQADIALQFERDLTELEEADVPQIDEANEEHDDEHHHEEAKAGDKKKGKKKKKKVDHERPAAHSRTDG
jgi:hypothetical protein